MPTGYTATLASGEQTVSDYIKSCARGMGFTVTMRDEPFDDSLPERFEPSDYHKLKADEVRAEIEALTDVAGELLAAACYADFDRHLKAAEDYNQRRVEQKERYCAMLEQVRSWLPQHEVMLSLRTFAIEQLQGSIDFDCSGEGMALPERISPSEWKAARLKQLHRDLNYHAGEYERECERVAKRNECLQELRNELAAISGAIKER